MIVEYGGQHFDFPDGLDDDKISQALQNLGIDEVERGGAALNMARAPDTLDFEEFDALATMSNGEALNFMKLNPEQKKFVDTIRTIETGGVQNPYIRTKAVGTGSSAYGPWQITKGLLESSLKSSPDMFDERETQAMQDLIQRQKIALAVGGSDRAKYGAGGAKAAQGAAWAKQYGFASVNDFLNAFDYGGDYGLSQDTDFQLVYEGVAHKLLVSQLDETGGDALEAASRWHGGRGWKNASSKAHTEIYRKRYQKLS